MEKKVQALLLRNKIQNLLDFHICKSNSKMKTMKWVRGTKINIVDKWCYFMKSIDDFYGKIVNLFLIFEIATGIKRS